MLIRIQAAVAAAPSEAADSPPDAHPGPTTAPVPFFTADAAIKTMNLAPGFRMEVVASEPMIEHPIAMSFDADGRMYVVEMRDYMPDPEGNGEKAPTGRVSVLEDTDGDGRADKSTVFIDKLWLPHAVSAVRDGALVDAPPKLLFCRDTDGDGKADEQTVVASDFGGLTANPENWPNGLIYSLDNWLYCASYDKRLRLSDGKWLTDIVPDIGQFGISQDDYGRLFHNTNSNYFRGTVVPLQYADRNPHFRAAGANEQIAYDQTVWPAHGTAVNRGYQPNFLREDGTLRKFTAACGPVIYRGGLFPKEFNGNAFVCEPSANVIRRAVISENEGILAADNAYANEHREFIASTYERFRPVNLVVGPDGALYVIDMHHGLLQHRTHLTTYARNQYLQRELEKYLNTGRIYRIVPENAKPFERPHLSKATSTELIAALSHPNGWWRDTAQRLLVERNDYRVAPALRKLAISGDNPLGRLHALWTLSGMRQLDVPTLSKALADSHAKNRAAAIRLCEPFLATANRSAFLPQIMKLAEDAQPDVRLQFALTISPLGTRQGDIALAKILNESGGANIYIRDAVIGGLRGREIEFLARLLESGDWIASDEQLASTLSALAKCVVTEGNPKRVAELLDLIAKQAPELRWRQLALLEGFPDPLPAAASSDGRASRAARRPKAIMFDTEPQALALLRNDDAQLPLKNALEIVHWPGQAGYKPSPPPRALTEAEQARFELGRQVYAKTCMQCHKTTGLGQEGLAPPLLDSEWALGPESRLARIVLQGVNGPITVCGETHILDMPALGTLKDDEIAAALTFVRRSWDHEADPVDPKTVAKIRAEEAQRTTSWTERELLKVK